MSFTYISRLPIEGETLASRLKSPLPRPLGNTRSLKYPGPPPLPRPRARPVKPPRENPRWKPTPLNGCIPDTPPPMLALNGAKLLCGCITGLLSQKSSYIGGLKCGTNCGWEGNGSEG